MPLPLPTIEIPSQPTRRVGLIDAAVVADIADVHMATAGAQWESESCTKARLYPTACATPPYNAITYDPREAFRTAYAFNVYASEICTPVGTTLSEAHRRVRARLALGAQTAIERALWGVSTDPVVGVFQAMNTAGLVTTVGPATALVEAVSLLEQQAATLSDGPILIHARPRMASYMGSRGLIDTGPFAPALPASAKALKRTHMGSTVVFGGGYSGNAPDGTTAPSATQEYMFATGRIFLWQSGDVDGPPEGVGDPTLNTTTNQRTIFAYRTVALSVECFAAAVQVTRAG
jgi:hypothetical protein